MPAIGLVDEPERERRDQDDADEHELQDAVHPERGADPVGQPAADRRADGHPAEEPGQDRRHRLGRVAEHEDQLAGPHDLVHEAGGTRQHEDRQDQRAVHPAECASPRPGAPVRRPRGTNGPWVRSRTAR